MLMKCEESGCQWSFYSKAKLNRHMKSHTKVCSNFKLIFFLENRILYSYFNNFDIVLGIERLSFEITRGEANCGFFLF